MEESRIVAGNITFVLEEVHNRNGDGLSVHIKTGEGGEEVSIVRLDWFTHMPHYHYNPGRENAKTFDIDPALVEDSLGWFLDRAAGRLPALVEKAGLPDVARRISGPDVAAAMPLVESTARAMAASALNSR